MKRTSSYLGLIAVALLLASLNGAAPAMAAPPAQTASAWTGFYFSNMNLQGNPAFVRDDSNIDFVWGSWGPGGGIGGENFSVRWIRWLFMDNPGNWTLTTITDDGVRLWVDDRLVIDAWHDQPPTAHSVTLNLTQAFHLVRMEYFQHCCVAEAHFRAQYTPAPAPQPTTPPADIWHGEYFDNPSLGGMPVLFRDDVNLNFDWGTAPPGIGISQGGNWSARWSSQRNMPNTGYYTVNATASDGVRVWVDDRILIDAWRDQTPTTYTAAVYLTQGQHRWRVEYYKHLGRAMLNMTISPGGASPTPAPQPGPQPFDITIDTRSPNFQKGNGPYAWTAFPNGYGGTAYWASNNTYTPRRYNWARWYLPPTRACYYEVSVYIPAGVATTRNARYWVAHAGRYELRQLNQAAHGNQWVSLGTFNFGGAGGEYVSLSDVTYEPYMSTIVVVDSVNFAPRCL
jgi:hypothetical protein